MFELTDVVLVIHPFWVSFIALVIGMMVALPIVREFKALYLFLPIALLVALVFTHFSADGPHVWILATFLAVGWIVVLAIALMNAHDKLMDLQGKTNHRQVEIDQQRINHKLSILQKDIDHMQSGRTS